MPVLGGRLDTLTRSTLPPKKLRPAYSPPAVPPAPPPDGTLDVPVSVRLSPEEVDRVYSGDKTSHSVRYSTFAPCRCVTTCPECSGMGRTRDSQILQRGKLVRCPGCREGGVPAPACKDCAGSGTVRLHREATVPCSAAAFVSGAPRRISRCGSSAFGRRGDAIVTFDTDHLPYDIFGYDVMFEVRVRASDPELNIVLPAPAGNMRVNSRMSFDEVPNPGHVYCFEQWGFTRPGGDRGHALIKVAVDYARPGKRVVAEDGVLVRAHCAQPPRRTAQPGRE